MEPQMSERGTTGISRTPEEREMEKKHSELATLEEELAQRELVRTTLQSELRAFEARYLRVVGIHYAELDELEAQIAEAQARLSPQDARLQEHASQSRTQAQESARTVGDRSEPRQPDTFQPSERLKKVYRDLAKRIHPDLTTDEHERTRRQRLMAEANDAYAAGDEPRLQAILRAWDISPEAVKGDGIAAELIRAIRQIAQVEDRLHAIEAELAAFKASDLYQLKAKVDEAVREGRDLLAEMAARIEKEIAAARRRLQVLVLGRRVYEQ
jgi:hypothetical protein